MLWSGRCEDPDSSLQLLQIMDIVRFWAEYTYKPMIGACLSRLQAMISVGKMVPLQRTLWSSRIALNEANTPWFSAQPRTYVPKAASPLAQINVIPEIDNYIWILDRDPRRGDLLVVRINENGTMCKPMVFFDSEDWTEYWDDSEFNSILLDEGERHDFRVMRGYTMNRKGHNYLWKCALSAYREKTQFWAILPLDAAAYNKQPTRSRELQLFEPLESLLKLPVLLASIDHANNKWCSCQRPYNDHSPSMIQCSNAQCDLGWYHRECVDVDETMDRTGWLCQTCQKIPKAKRRDLEPLNIDEDDSYMEASFSRVQRTRVLARAWEKHTWPKADDIVHKFRRIILNLDIVKSAAYTLHRTGVLREGKVPRSWVLSKNKPKKLIMASSGKKQLVYHKEVGKDNGEDDSCDTDEEDLGLTHQPRGGIENALGRMSLG